MSLWVYMPITVGYFMFSCFSESLLERHTHHTTKDGIPDDKDDDYGIHLQPPPAPKGTHNNHLHQGGHLTEDDDTATDDKITIVIAQPPPSLLSKIKDNGVIIVGVIVVAIVVGLMIFILVAGRSYSKTTYRVIQILPFIVMSTTYVLRLKFLFVWLGAGHRVDRARSLLQMQGCKL